MSDDNYMYGVDDNDPEFSGTHEDCVSTEDAVPLPEAPIPAPPTE